MKIKGKTIGAPKPRLCVIERDDEQFVFTLQAVLDYTDFDAVCPKPEPPKVLRPGGDVTENITSPVYLKTLEEYGTQKTYWLIIKSLEATEGLEWEKVNLSDPDTWELYKDELTDCGLTEGEIVYLINQIYNVNSLDEERMKEALDRFTHSQSEEQV